MNVSGKLWIIMILLPFGNWGQMVCFKFQVSFFRHFTEERPLLVGPTESRPRSVRLTKIKMAGPVKRFIFFVFVPHWSD